MTTELLPVGLLPQIGSALEVSDGTAGLLVSAYAGTVAVLSVPLALVTRRLPRKPVLLATLGGYVVSNVVAAAAPTFGVLAAGRHPISGPPASAIWSVTPISSSAPKVARLSVPPTTIPSSTCGPRPHPTDQLGTMNSPSASTATPSTPPISAVTTTLRPTSLAMRPDSHTSPSGNGRA